jgi:arylsulfatase A-like enzyme
LLAATSASHAQDKPNIVLLFADNFGFGELGSYGGGITRGAPTPRLDALAREGTRLTVGQIPGEPEEISARPDGSR